MQLITIYNKENFKWESGTNLKTQNQVNNSYKTNRDVANLSSRLLDEEDRKIKSFSN